MKFEQSVKNSFGKLYGRWLASRHHRESLAFLPAALEVQKTPPSPIGRTILWLIMLFFTLAFVWAWFGKVDIIATSTGQLIPSGKSKVIQPVEAGKISGIYVKDGDHVKKGQILVSLNSTMSQADVQKLSEQLHQYENDIKRINSVLSYINKKSDFNKVTIPEGLENSQILYLKKQISEYNEQLANLKSQELQYQSEIFASKATFLKLKNTLPIVEKRLQSTENLYHKSYVSEDQYLKLKQDYISQKQDLEVEKYNIQKNQALLEQINTQRNLLDSQTQQKLLQSLMDAKHQKLALQQELVKAKESKDYTDLRSPIDGDVQQLAITTIGGVVTPAEELMVIVPSNQSLEVSAKLLNKDIGFVNENQAAEVKVNTFNFTKYGMIDATVENISDAAAQDKDLGWVYDMKLAIDKNNIRVNGKTVKLSPGMEVVAEIKTGQRRIIEYLLTPLLRYKQESIRER